MQNSPLASLKALEKSRNKDGFFRVTVLDEIASTNTYLKKLAETGEKEGAVVIARRQTGGRGRRGRSFASAEGGLYMSVLLRPKLPPERATLLTTATAVAVLRAVKRVTGIAAAVKWVNDILIRQKKVAGILAEAAASDAGDRLRYAVIGIGVNVDSITFPPDVAEIATSLRAHTNTPFSIADLADAILDALREVFAEIESAAFMDEYRAASLAVGRRVSVITPTHTYDATATAVRDDGALEVIDEGGIRRILNSGEISIKM